MRSLALTMVLVGCSCGGAQPAPTAPPPSSAAGTYAVHEWGLIRAQAGDTLRVGAMGPTVPRYDMMVVEKPVLYFHLADDAAPLALASVGVEALGGAVVEHWPHTGVSASPQPASIAWTGLRLEPSACTLTPPGAADRPCSDLAGGEDCESMFLDTAATTDAACVHGGGWSSPLLFYRSTCSALTVPLVVTRRPDGDIDVRNDGERPIPGTLVRFRRQIGTASVALGAPPAPHATVQIGHDFTDAGAARTSVTESLVGLGLTASEASAFLASWDTAFFGAPVETPVAEEEHLVERTPAPEESLLYFLPPEDVERVARLSFDPPPREVRRALAVWTAY